MNKEDDTEIWSTIAQFTDEQIVQLDRLEYALFATTKTDIIWVSFDRGKTWELQDELLRKAIKSYQHKRNDLTKDYQRRLLDIEIDYQRELNKLYPAK